MSGFSKLALPAAVAQGVMVGDRKAIAEAYKVLAQAVMGLSARILQDRSLAEEVVQDTFIELVEKWPQIRTIEAIPGWVRRVAVNHCLMRLRSPWHSRRSAADAEAVIESQQDEVSLDWVAQVPSLERALGSLGEETRAVIWLHDVEGYTHKEIGEFMGRTSSYSKSQLARGYKKLLAWRTRQEVGSVDKTTDAKNRARKHKDRCGSTG
ncbi:MAG: sigma-70 family RNA polymerase sigma factor, partial [Gammaproteobacteria bacterium]|nr:sigma-70 family RNA polymerase sigma factor [Gammaproteobacteria bacterium]